MEHGIIRDWNDMERIWHYIFSKEQLQTVSEEVFLDVIACLFLLCLSSNVPFFCPLCLTEIYNVLVIWCGVRDSYTLLIENSIFH